jgi:hypothetical protein
LFFSAAAFEQYERQKKKVPVAPKEIKSGLCVRHNIKFFLQGNCFAVTKATMMWQNYYGDSGRREINVKIYFVLFLP